MEANIENNLDLEREELLRFIYEKANTATLRALALVPDEPHVYETAIVTTSTEGTGYARVA